MEGIERANIKVEYICKGKNIQGRENINFFPSKNRVQRIEKYYQEKKELYQKYDIHMLNDNISYLNEEIFQPVSP